MTHVDEEVARVALEKLHQTAGSETARSFGTTRFAYKEVVAISEHVKRLEAMLAPQPKIPLPAGYKHLEQPSDDDDLDPALVAEIKDELAKFYGEAPYDKLNYAYGDGYFIHAIEKKYNMYFHELRKIAGRE